MSESAARGRPAALLDRDGTIIRDVNYLGRAEEVELLPGAAAAIRRLNAAGIPVVVITNQSGIARGYFDDAAYVQVKARLDVLLEDEGARLDGTFMCPHHPDFSGPCDCRKPGTLLYHQAAEELRLDLSRSWFVGDKWRDAEPALAFGGRPVLVPAPDTPAADLARAREQGALARSLGEVADAMIGELAPPLHPDGGTR